MSVFKKHTKVQNLGAFSTQFSKKCDKAPNLTKIGCIRIPDSIFKKYLEIVSWDRSVAEGNTTFIYFVTRYNKSMKVYSTNIGKILINININEHILPIFLINFINKLAKTIKYKESFNGSLSKLYVRFRWNLRSKFSLPFSLCNGLILISNRTTSFWV